MNVKRMTSLILSLVLLVSVLTGCNSAAAPTTAATTAANTAADTTKAASATTGAATTTAATTAAAKWPNGAVQLLVPSKAGGITDIYTRYVQKSLQTSTNGKFGVVNYDTEAVGYENLRSAKADGSSILFQHSTLIAKYLTGAVNYNPATEFKVVGVVANMGSQAIITNPNAPYSTWEEFVAYAKTHPNEILTGIATNGTTHFIFGQVQSKYDIKLNFVEASAEADKLINVAGGNINLANCSLGNAKEYEAAGKIKVLGVLGSGKPEPLYPQWKPITDVLWVSYLYALAPASMDDATANAINLSLKTLVNDPAYVEECKKIGGSAEWLDLASAKQNFADTIVNLTKIATSLGINKR